MMVITCRLCRAWYNMDMEPHLADEHFNFATGEPCLAGDDDWYIIQVAYRDDWAYAY